MHRCYVPDASGDRVVLPADEAHHLTRVLRAGPGAEVLVFDGRGREWTARVDTVTRASTTVQLVAARTPVAEPLVDVTLAIGLLKGDQMHAVVRDATALGVIAILPVVSEHVAMPAAAWRVKAGERWGRIAVAAAKQSGRAVVPRIAEVAAYDEVLRSSTCERLVCCVEPARVGGVDVSGDDPGPRPRSALVCIGPEGGWSADELAIAHARGAALLTLGPRTLRAETAPTVALSALWTRWGWS